MLRFYSVLQFAQGLPRLLPEPAGDGAPLAAGALVTEPARTSPAVASSAIQTAGQPPGGSPARMERPRQPMTTTTNEIDDETTTFANLGPLCRHAVADERA
jgi:hypothetical protein